MNAEDDLSKQLMKALELDREARFDEAAALCDGILDARPEQPHVLCLLGRIRRRQGRYDEAAALLERARERSPGLPQVLAEGGFLALSRNDPRTAIQCFSALLSLKPGVADHHFNLACALDMAGMFGEAARHLHRALALHPSRPQEVLARLGSALLMVGRQDAAAERFDAALELEPDDPSALYGLGMVRSARGDFEAAGELFRRAVSLDPELVDAWQQLAVIRRYESEDDADLKSMRSVLESGDCTPIVREKLNFALGKIHDDLGDYESAYGHYAEANRLKHARVPRFDREIHRALVDRIIATFTSELFAERAHGGSSSRTPLPIFGMPRSGTTLVEQILSSHSRVDAGGEKIHFERLSQSFGADWPQTVRDWDEAQLARVAEGYLSVLGQDAGDVERVTDKMPVNFMHAGLIHLLFPRAPLIHCRRDAVDTCLSIFFLDFGIANFYANDLNDIAFYYEKYTRLIEHWRTVLPESMFEVDYAALVADHERAARDMIAFCGLEWEENCLDFAKNERAVATPSRWQVRQPIYTRSLNRRDNYAPYIRALTAALERGV
ncbi:tetratricopeptide repeat-containing sulfotransferase family protein [soil metagenome]